MKSISPAFFALACISSALAAPAGGSTSSSASVNTATSTVTSGTSSTASSTTITSSGSASTTSSSSGNPLLSSLSSVFASSQSASSSTSSSSATSSGLSSSSTSAVTSFNPTSTTSGSAVLPTSTSTGPVQGGASINDTTILQLALALGYLENSFFSQGLNQFNAGAFKKDRYPHWVRNRIIEIGSHENSHVNFLTEALQAANATVPKACNYTFPLTDARSFVVLAESIESVGGAAYITAIAGLKEAQNVEAAASIMAIKQREAAWINSAVLKHSPWDGGYETPISASAAFSMALPFIVECPSSNPPLPISFFPALNITQTPSSPGDSITVKYEGANFGTNSAYLAFLSGLNTTVVALDESGSATTPSGLLGTVFIGVVSDENGTVTDKNMLSGFNMLNFEFDSYTGGNA